MSSWVEMLIAEPQKGVVVARHYIGGNGVARAIPEIMGRPADQSEGFNSWGRITPDEMRAIIEYRYWHGLSPETLTAWLERFPPEHYVWAVIHTY